ncbi:MAG: RHS repeat-associated core domain-containing protein, partial [Gammaproteobacteria bacterium]
MLNRDNEPLSGVTLTVKDHPELGQTLSRSDGEFDMAVNGGGLLTIHYEKPGYLPAQRQVQTPWQDYALVDDVVMVALDQRVTTIDLSSNAPIQVAQGSVITDQDGTRQATVFFPAGTGATMTLAEGTTQSLTTLEVRATEYTVGENGPRAMPGPLPTSSGYTYAVDLSVDAALAAGAMRVDFDQSLPLYVDNFLNFPVGGIVPVGWYDKAKSAWIPSANGRVIKILSTTGGTASLDTDGDDLADDTATLTALGITDAELAQLASLYPAGKTLWRSPITHFTPWDCNWPYGPPLDSEPPPPPDDSQDPPPDEDSDDCPGCSINAQARTLGELLPITGTAYTLHYQSRRANGYQPDRALAIRLAGAGIPASLQGIDLTVTVAGQRFTQAFPAAPNQSYRFVWDGLDGYGRPVTGSASATVTVSYRYNAVYYAAPADFEQSFAQASAGAGSAVIGTRGASTIAVTRTWQKDLAGSPAAQAVGDWSLSTHHRYDAVHRLLDLGTGEHRAAGNMNNVITTVAGNGTAGYSGDGGPAAQAKLYYPETIALGPDGSLYIADTFNNRIRRVGPDGIITTVAGTGKQGYNGDGGPATQAITQYPLSIALGPDGSLYIADYFNHRIRRVGLDGVITAVAGTAHGGYGGDGGPATQAKLWTPSGLALGPDGSLYIADSGNNHIRRVGPDGVITTVTGTGHYGYAGDGGPATQAKLFAPSGLALGPDGSLYIADTDNNRIRRVGPDGVITTVTGTGQYRYGGDGGPATQAQLFYPRGIALGPDGSPYIADSYNHRIRRVGPDGVITTVTGTGQGGYGGDGGPATQAKLYYPRGIALGPDGSLYITDSYNYRIRRVGPALPGLSLNDTLIPSADGVEIYHFDAQGRHLRTLSALTGAERYRFGYDAAGQLHEITDLDGDITRIERDSQGQPTAIVAPDGQRTTLSLDANGNLASVTNPAGEAHRMVYTPGGLITRFTDPKGNANDFEYDDLGRLLQDTNAGLGGWTIAYTENAAGYTNAMTTAEGRTTTFAVEPRSTGDRRQVNTYPDGTVQTKLFKTNGEETTTAPDGTVTTLIEGPDPRFAMQAPVPAAITVKLPSGLTSQITTTRTAPLSNANDLLSLTILTKTTTANGKAYTSTFDKATRTYTHTSPAGRVATTVVNDQHRPLLRQLTGLNAVNHTYDPRGRLTETTTGARTTHLGYYESGPSQGYL